MTRQSSFDGMPTTQNLVRVPTRRAVILRASGAFIVGYLVTLLLQKYVPGVVLDLSSSDFGLQFQPGVPGAITLLIAALLYGFLEIPKTTIIKYSQLILTILFFLGTPLTTAWRIRKNTTKADFDSNFVTEISRRAPRFYVALYLARNRANKLLTFGIDGAFVYALVEVTAYLPPSLRIEVPSLLNIATVAFGLLAASMLLNGLRLDLARDLDVPGPGRDIVQFLDDIF